VVAAVGGVGSISGVFLMDGLLRGREPDVCFVDFATTDLAGYTPPGKVGAAVEGIVRKLLRMGSRPVLLHLYRSDVDWRASHPAIEASEGVAARYRVPLVDVASAWARRRDAPSRFLRDAVHLTRAGAEACADAIVEALTTATDPTVEAPLHADVYDATLVREATPDLLSDPARAARRVFRFNYPVLDVEPDVDLVLEDVRGVVGLVVVVGPDSGEVEIEDGERSRRVILFDEYCHYERLNTIVFSGTRADPGRVRVRLTRAAVDTSVCRQPVPPRAPGERRLSVVGLMIRAPRSSP
jgi:hypothetical protein